MQTNKHHMHATLQEDWPSDLLTTWEGGNPPTLPNDKFVTLTTAFHYENAPHDAWYSKYGGLIAQIPKFGFKFAVTNMTLTDIGDILYDIASSFAAGSVSRLDLSEVQKHIDFRFHVSAELSLFEQENLFKGGLFLDAGVDALLFGLGVNFQLKVDIPIPRNEQDLANFRENPLSLISQAGFNVAAKIVLPYGIGRAELKGELTHEKIDISANLNIVLGSVNFACMEFKAYSEFQNAETLELSMAANLDLEGFLQVGMAGKINSNSLALSGYIDVDKFGMKFCGGVNAEVSGSDFIFQFQSFLKLGFLGTGELTGRVENKGIYVRGDLAITDDIRGQLEGVIRDFTRDIFGTRGSGWFAWITATVANFFIPIRRVTIVLDTVSRKFTLEIAFRVFGVEVVLDGLEFNFRRRLAGSPERKYTHVKAYLAKRRLEAEAEQSVATPQVLASFPQALRDQITKCFEDATNVLEDPKRLVDMVDNSVDPDVLREKMDVCGTIARDTQSATTQEACVGPYSSRFPRCEAEIQKMLENNYWNRPEYTNRDSNLDGSRCSIQQHLAFYENKCPLTSLTCVIDQNCLNGWCHGSVHTENECKLGTCMPFKEVGEPCGGSNQFANDYKCTRSDLRGACHHSTGRCFLLGEDGDSCSRHRDCLSGKCYERKCTRPRCVTAVAAGGSHSMALMQDGTVWATGKNDAGQLGLGHFDTPVSSFTKVESLTVPVVLVAAGGSHSMVVTNDGRLLATGNNIRGQNGFGRLSFGNTRRGVFRVVKGGHTDVTAIALGNAHSILLKQDGTVYVAGESANGQLGIGLRDDYKSNFQHVRALEGVKAVAAGASHSMALTQDGDVWVAGVVSALPRVLSADSRELVVDTFTKVENLKASAVSAGFAYSLALSTDGVLHAAGINSEGQFGDGSTQNSQTFKVVNGSAPAATVYAGGSHSVIVKQDGIASAAGNNGDGQLGLGSTATNSTVFAVIPGDHHTSHVIMCRSNSWIRLRI